CDQGLLMHLDSVREQAGVPLLLSAGTALPGTRRPRYMSALESAAAGNLYHRAISSAGGYWFWALTNLGDPEQRQPFVDMLRLVNGQLDKYYESGGTFGSHLRARPFPVEQPENLARLTRDVAQWVAVPEEALPANPPEAWGLALRGNDLALAVPAEDGQDLSFVVRNHRLAQYSTPAHVAFFTPDGSVIDRESIPIAEGAWSTNVQTVSQRARGSGVWVLAVSGGPPVVANAFSVLPQTRSAVAIPADGVLGMFAFSGSTPFETSVFFYVPRGSSTFGIRLSGAAVLRLFDGSGQPVLEHRDGVTHRLDMDDGQDGAAREPGNGEMAVVTVDGEQAGRVWWVQITEAGWGSYSIALEGIPAVYAARPGQLVVPEL
ncbi:hypothetical protein ACFL6X_08625, partial [Candidatus Latescibacterota bacterium]